MKGNTHFSISKRITSFINAFKGIVYFFTTQHNAWIQIAAAVIVIILGIILQINQTEWILIIFATGLVFTAECFNTSIEKLTNLFSPHYNEAAGMVKDISAGAVLISAIFAAIIGGIVFLPKLLYMINT